jgi:predicted kinase
MKNVIITIGIPGSGKTTATESLVQKYQLSRVSRDEIRKELFGNPFQQAEDVEAWKKAEHDLGEPLVSELKMQVWKEAECRTRAALEADCSVVIDGTFSERRKREEAIRTARENGAERIIGLYFPIDVDSAKARNKSREHSVDDAVIEMMYRQLQQEPPHVSEGFDAMYTVEQIAELEENELRG